MYIYVVRTHILYTMWYERVCRWYEKDVGTKNFSPSPKSFAIQLESKHAIAFIDKRRYYIDQQGMDRGFEEL